MMPTAEGLAYLTAVLPIASGSVDRLDQVPARLSFLFDYSPEATLADAAVRGEMSSEGARAVAVALARALAAAPRLDRDRFRAIANQLKAETGQKARALFHPIRIAITGRAAGPELDLAVPAIDTGAELPPSTGLPAIVGCRERAQAFADALQLVNR
jgi:glutamyl/glutaminyl-tRNA synthetase